MKKPFIGGTIGLGSVTIGVYIVQLFFDLFFIL